MSSSPHHRIASASPHHRLTIAYHRLAISLAKAAGVDMLDRYEPTFPLQELATAEHYGEPAAHEAAHLILDWLKERGVVTNTVTCPRSRGAPRSLGAETLVG